MHSFNYGSRFKKGLEYHQLNVDAITALVNVVRKRAGSDRAVDSAFSNIMNILEPGGCQKSHCTYHGSGGFCCCGKDLVPSKCQDHREFVARQHAKFEKVYQEGRELGAKAKAGTAEYDKTKYGEDHNKRTWFETGMQDGYSGKPQRSIPDGKLKLEWGEISKANVDEFITFTDYDACHNAINFYELSRASVFNLHWYEMPGLYAIRRHDRSYEALKKIAETKK